MIYENVSKGVFVSRPNRFIAMIKMEENLERVHVKNTGRCQELLIPGTTVYLNKAANPNRATQYDLIAAEKDGRLINMDSGAPNIAFLDFLQSGKYLDGITTIKPEAKYGSSRFDFYLEIGKRRIFIEVKGVTLEENGIALFPDAPTQRGLKHLNELTRCLADRYEARIVFVVQMTGVGVFTPNNRTHPAFGEALIAARDSGVIIEAFDCYVTPGSLSIRQPVKVRLSR